MKEVVITTKEWLRALLWTRKAARLRLYDLDLSTSRIARWLVARLEGVEVEEVTVRMAAWWIAELLSCIPFITARVLVVLGFDYLEVPVWDFRPCLESRRRFVSSILEYAITNGVLALIRVHDEGDEAWVAILRARARKG